MPIPVAAMYLQSREFGDAGFALDEVRESRRSKLVPYGLLSSSFHMMLVLGRNTHERVFGSRVLFDGSRRQRGASSRKLQAALLEVAVVSCDDCGHQFVIT
jgi:hypothetical protein